MQKKNVEIFNFCPNNRMETIYYTILKKTITTLEYGDLSSNITTDSLTISKNAFIIGQSNSEYGHCTYCIGLEIMILFCSN
jgi:hypothetical protein